MRGPTVHRARKPKLEVPFLVEAQGECGFRLASRRSARRADPARGRHSLGRRKLRRKLRLDEYRFVDDDWLRENGGLGDLDRLFLVLILDFEGLLVDRVRFVQLGSFVELFLLVRFVRRVSL